MEYPARNSDAIVCEKSGVGLMVVDVVIAILVGHSFMSLFKLSNADIISPGVYIGSKLGVG
jgi:hypothetical protein